MTATNGCSRNVFARWTCAAARVALVVILGWAAAGAQEREFQPVTDAMLQNPDPADWLNWRRTLDGWGFRSRCLVTS